MFNFFKKNKIEEKNENSVFEIELTAAVLAYEIARIQLESSFDITKSIGFLNYKKKMSNTNN